jgi:starch-binding outer membrane protein, SusD/RagB family
MKKIFIILFVAVILASCEKKLSQVPISTATTETFYKQPSDFIQAVNATYNSLRGFPDRALFLSEVRSDNIYPTNDVGRDPDPINNFSIALATSPLVDEAWTANFSGIFKANTVIDQIAKNGSYIGSAQLATRLNAEAKFLRAFFYFDLVKYFGKVPVIDHPVSAAEAVKIGRSPIADVYTLIISDLQFAVANLPSNFSGPFPNYTSADVGRATKFAAESLLAEVYMARSGPTYSIEGPGMGLNEWGQALTLLQDVITNGGFVFRTQKYTFPDTGAAAAQIFSYTNQSPTTNKEAVFDVMYLNGQNPVLGATYPWQLVPQSYLNTLAGTNAAGALGTPSVSNDLLNSYSTVAPIDTRKAPFLHTTPYNNFGTTDLHAFFRKYLDTSKIPPNNNRFDWGINFIVIRYTDILMRKAECILHGATGTQTDVDAIVNQVRARANQPAISNVTLPQLFIERRKEFASEGNRWFDLQRSGDLLTIMNAWKNVEDATLHKIGPIVANSVIYPVPQSQIDAAPGLYIQNPGY